MYKSNLTRFKHFSSSYNDVVIQTCAILSFSLAPKLLVSDVICYDTKQAILNLSFTAYFTVGTLKPKMELTMLLSFKIDINRDPACRGTRFIRKYRKFKNHNKLCKNNYTTFYNLKTYLPRRWRL